ncbi:hypothetical protein BV20DRAFT_1056128 [Pilatotrama ljubarskyi]|nr:hypothetical protein BV20DRAFT_1056128 [Pilatotrama ljubarskyi]
MATDMRATPGPGFRRPPWIGSVEAYAEAQQRLPVLTEKLYELLSMWQCMSRWNTNIAFSEATPTPGLPTLSIWFRPPPQRQRPFPGAPLEEHNIILMDPSWWMHHYVGPTTETMHAVERGMGTGHPEPQLVLAQTLIIENVDWITLDISGLPLIRLAFRSFWDLEALEFRRCTFSANALRALEMAFSGPAAGSPHTVKRLSFEDCAYHTGDVAFLAQPTPSCPWARLTHIDLLVTVQSTPGETQGDLLRALSMLGPQSRLRELRYTVPNRDDLWKLGSIVEGFSQLTTIHIWVRRSIDIFKDKPSGGSTS